MKNDNAKTHAHEQNSDGETVRGSYRVDLPDGRIQIVSYVADDNGYRADVRYEGKSLHYTPVVYKEAKARNSYFKSAPEPEVCTQKTSPDSYKTEKNNQEEAKNLEYTVNTYTEKPFSEPPVTEYSLKDDYRSKESSYQVPPRRESVVYEHAKTPENPYLEPPIVDHLVKNDYHSKESTPRRGSVVYHPDDSEIQWHREHRPRKSPRISRPRNIIEKPLVEKESAQSQDGIKINEFEDISKKTNDYFPSRTKTDVPFTSSERTIDISTIESTQSPKVIKTSEDFISKFISFEEKMDADYDDVTEKPTESLVVSRWNNRNIERVPTRAIVAEKTAKTTRGRNSVAEVTENTRKSPVFRTSSNRQSIVNDLTQPEQKDATEPTRSSLTKYNSGLERSRNTINKPISKVNTPLQETTEQSNKQDTERATNGVDKSIYSVLRPKMLKPNIFESPSDKIKYETSDGTESTTESRVSVTKNLEIVNLMGETLENDAHRQTTKPNKVYQFTSTTSKPRVSHITSDLTTTKPTKFNLFTLTTSKPRVHYLTTESTSATSKPNKVYNFTPITTSKPYVSQFNSVSSTTTNSNQVKHFTPTTTIPKVDYLTSESTLTTTQRSQVYRFPTRTPKPSVRYFTSDSTTTTTEPNVPVPYHFTPTTKIPKVYYFTPDSTPVTTLPKVYYFTPNTEHLPIPILNSEKPKEGEINWDPLEPESNFEDLLFETPWEDTGLVDTLPNDKTLEEASVTVPGGTFELSDTSDVTRNPLEEVSKSSETIVETDTAIEDLLFETAWKDEKDSSVVVTTKDISQEENIGLQSLPLIQTESNSASRKQYAHGVLYGGNGQIYVHKP